MNIIKVLESVPYGRKIRNRFFLRPIVNKSEKTKKESELKKDHVLMELAFYPIQRSDKKNRDDKK